MSNRSRSRTRSRLPVAAPPPESTLLRWLRDKRITEVECLVPDLTGNARGKIIPADKFRHDYGTRLPEGIFATTVTGDFPDDYHEIIPPSDSDMLLRPDPTTVRMVPWAADPMGLADQVFLFKRTMREAALRHGIYATFLAKPMENEPGSAMHIHQSLVRVADGVNVFSGEVEGEISPLLGHYIAGLQKYVPAAMAFFAPNVNSYRRLMFGEVSPSNVHWGYDNRTCGLRVPLDSHENMRVESRFAGSDANPYLAMAATLACGLLGIREQLQPTPAQTGSAKVLGYDLPRSLGEALDHLQACQPLQELIGPRFCRAYTSVKHKEYETFFRVISSWEREFLLLNV